MTRLSALQARFKDIYDVFTSDAVKFYLLVAVFFSMVFILPMIPMLMFIYTENSPSINPDVFVKIFQNAKNDVENRQQSSTN